MTTKSELESARTLLLGQVPPEGRVLAAVSGGLDSMCLLHFLNTWGRDWGFEVVAAHFNHQLREQTADRDEAFVKEYCARNGIPFVCGRADVRALAAEEGLTLEEAARKARYAFLEHVAKEKGCTRILTAHHADDNAETMLLNLLRGTGLQGLCGIPESRGLVLRPFRDIPRKELETYAAGHGLPHVEDETNALDDAARNVLRHQVLPVMKQLNSAVVEHMARTARLLEADQEALETEAAALADATRRKGDGLWMPLESLQQAPLAIQNRVILALLAETCGRRKDLTATHVEAVRTLPRGGQADLPYAMRVRNDGRYLIIEQISPLPEPVVLETEAVYGSWRIVIRSTPERDRICYALDPARLPFTVTAWRSGDRMLLPGTRGQRSLKRLCAEHGIPPFLRDTLPVLRAGSVPVAVPGVGLDKNFAPTRNGETVFAIFYQETEESNHEE